MACQFIDDPLAIMENVRTFGILVALPVVCTWRFLLSFAAKQERQKTWRRVLSDSMFRWVVDMHPIPRLAYLLGHTQDIYTRWAKRNKMKTCIHDIGENAKLLWILDEKSGGQIPSRVILYLHGGGFYLPMFEDAASFWHHVQKKLRDTHGMDVGIAILDYSLVPEAHFPVPLRQTIAALQYLFSRGLKPSDLVLTGDSAGGNLTIQVLLHILHPLEGLPTLGESKFAGAYLMSPWLTLLPREKSSQESYQENARWDIVSPAKLADLGHGVLSPITDERHLPYIDSYFAPSGWYDDMGAVVQKLLITVGRYECLREDTIRFGKHLETATRPAGDLDVALVVDKCGVHDDPLFDFIAGEKKLGELTPMIISWCRDAFRG